MNIQHKLRMTASEIAMGRYMRAPDHSAADAFDTAFADFASPDDKKPDDAAAAGATGGDAAAAAGGGDAGSSGASGDGSGGAAGDSGAGAAASGDGAAASGSGDGAAAAAGGEGAAGASGDGASGQGASGDGAGASGADAGAGAGAGADAGAAAAAAAAGSGPDADAILDGLRKLVGQAAPKDDAAAAGGAGEGGAAQAPIYDDDETKFLEKYEADWGDVSRGESLKRRAEYQQLVGHIFAEVGKFLKPIQETAEALAQRTFTTDVKAAVPDYSDQLRSDVVEWVKSQPTYLQVAYNHVITEGTVDEVKDLVERYRTATGKAAPTSAGADSGKSGAAAAQAGGGNELSDEAKKAAAALAPVDSKRSGVQAPSDPSNFEDAWKQAAADLG